MVIPNVFQKLVFSCAGILNFELVCIDPVLHRVCFDVSFAWFGLGRPEERGGEQPNCGLIDFKIVFQNACCISKNEYS
jgi:hypothetical protein